MTDQTPVTDDDRRSAREWAEDFRNSMSIDSARAAASRVILATVPAPPKSLSEQMLDIAGGISSDFGAYADDLNTLAGRAEAVEKEVTEAVRDRDEALSWVDNLTRERDEARAEVERLTATFKEPLKEPGHLPDPADVPVNTFWLIEFEGKHYEARRIPWSFREYHWSFMRDGAPCSAKDDEVTLVARLVPDTRRVITDSDELEQLAATSIIRDGRGWPGGITDQGVTMINGFCLSDEDVLEHGPVTVLWEPGVTA